jgi:hypothetical protein
MQGVCGWGKAGLQRGPSSPRLEGCYSEPFRGYCVGDDGRLGNSVVWNEPCISVVYLVCCISIVIDQTS